MPGKKVPERERQEQILRAAVSVAQTRGLAGLTVRTVAAEAGISVGLVFFHFPTMDALRAALLDWLLEQVLWLDHEAIRQKWATPHAQVLGMLAEELTAAQALRPEIALLLEYWVLGIQDPALRDRLQQAFARYAATVADLVAEAMDAGAAPALPAGAVAATLVRAILGLSLEAVLTNTPADVPEQIAVLGALIPPRRA